jgi:hypothetical protein
MQRPNMGFNVFLLTGSAVSQQVFITGKGATANIALQTRQRKHMVDW